MGIRSVVLVAFASACSIACAEDKAAPALAKCIDLDVRGDLDGALGACADAVNLDPDSKAGRTAKEKFDALKEKYVAQKAKLDAESAVQNAAQRQADEAARIKAGGWVHLKLPGEDPASRRQYMSDVLEAHPGEPALNKKAAAAFMEKARVALAKAAGISASQVVATVGTTSGTLKVADRVMAGIAKPDGDALEVGACSEPYLGIAMLDLVEGKAASAGLRGILCTSNGCAGTFDLRPGRPDGGGMYGGDSCISFDQVAAMAGLK